MPHFLNRKLVTVALIMGLLTPSMAIAQEASSTLTINQQDALSGAANSEACTDAVNLRIRGFDLQMIEDLQNLGRKGDIPVEEAIVRVKYRITSYKNKIETVCNNLPTVPECSQGITTNAITILQGQCNEAKEERPKWMRREAKQLLYRMANAHHTYATAKFFEELNSRLRDIYDLLKRVVAEAARAASTIDSWKKQRTPVSYDKSKN